MADQEKNSSTQKSEPSCTSRLTRKEFLAKVVKAATIAGTITAAPVIADVFVAPPAFAQASTNMCCPNIESVTDCQADTDICADTCGDGTDCL